MKEPQGSAEFIAEQKRRLADNPECATSSYNLGVTLMQQGKLDEAADCFRNALRAERRHGEVYSILSEYFRQDPAAWDDARGLVFKPIRLRPPQRFGPLHRRRTHPRTAQ